MDINITNTINNKYEFKVHRKKAITNIISNQHHVLTLTPLKVYLKVSFTEHTRYVLRNILKKKKKKNFIMFVEHGHNKQLLKNLVVEYNNKKNNKNNYENNTQNRDYANLNKLPWIPNISPKMTREFKKIGKDIAFTSGGDLQQILCQKNTPKLLPNS